MRLFEYTDFSYCYRIFDFREWIMHLFFFFSSRRRHTRYWRDWSSDVCSSDLTRPRQNSSSLGPITRASAVAIGPSEELFWRGLVQRNLHRRFGRLRGWLLASSIYGAVHLVSENLTLTGAATTAGLFWGALYARDQRLTPLVVSHISWDLWIFLVAPTG